MFHRSLGLLAASLSLAFAVASVAAPVKHVPRHHAATSGPALLVRGDQVSTEDLVNKVARAFAATGDGHLVVTPFNTVDGIDQALSGQVDMAAVARPADPQRSQEAGLTFTPVAWDALVFVTNASNPVSNLTLKQVWDIYYGKIKNWSALGGADAPIDLDGVASPLDGVQYSFRRLLFGNGAYPVAVPRLFINIDSLQSEIALDNNALALSTLSHARNQKGLKILSVEGITPSYATLQSGQYPLPLKIYLAYKTSNPKLATIKKFIAFLGGTQAGGIMSAHSLVPYAEATALNAKSEMDRVNAVGAYLVAEGLPANYAPGNEFARLAGNTKEIARAEALQEAAAKVVEAQKAAAAQQAAPDPPAPPPVATRSYTVVSGDTLSRIADKYSVSVADLRKWNGIHGNLIRVGQVLKIKSH
ncbi:MAG TPA: substrate-binding domain-containing protein [Rhodanobacteraceae bacterium]